MAEIKPVTNHKYSTFPFQFQELDLIIRHNYCTALRRGPMYSAYAELREQKLRRSRAGGCGAAFAAPRKKRTAAPSPLSHPVPEFSMAVAKENKKPTPLEFVPRAEAWMTRAASLAPKSATKRVMWNASAAKAEEKRLHGGGDGGVMLPARKSYTCLKELKEYSAMASLAICEAGHAAKFGNKGTGKRAGATACSRRQSMSPWLG